MSDGLIACTTEIVASYVGGNQVSANDLPALIQSVYQALTNAEAPQEPAAPAAERATAAQIKKSFQPGGLVSFEDGKTYKLLKRHLIKRGLTPATYRAKWGLPADYPMTSPEYSAVRSQMSKALGLGRSRKTPDEPKASARKGKPKAAKA